jgi:hypothetical protein
MLLICFEIREALRSYLGLCSRGKLEANAPNLFEGVVVVRGGGQGALGAFGKVRWW